MQIFSWVCVIIGAVMKTFAEIIKKPKEWMRAAYDWTVKWAESDKALYALFVVAVMESAFFPVPVDVLMIPICVADNKRSFYFAGITLVGSILGAYLGYLIGYAFFESAGEAIFTALGLQEFADTVIKSYSDNAFFAIVGAGFTPIPYKVFTIVAGIAKINLLTFTVASVIGRGSRFFLVAGLLRVFGDEIKDAIEKYFDIFSIIFLILLIGGFVIIKLV